MCLLYLAIGQKSVIYRTQRIHFLLFAFAPAERLAVSVMGSYRAAMKDTKIT